MDVRGEYFLFGNSTSATLATQASLEKIGLSPASGVGNAISPGQLAEFATVAYFTLQSATGGDLVGAALQIIQLVQDWSKTDGRPSDVKRCDLVIKNRKSGKEVMISGFEYKDNSEISEIISDIF